RPTCSAPRTAPSTPTPSPTPGTGSASPTPGRRTLTGAASTWQPPSPSCSTTASSEAPHRNCPGPAPAWPRNYATGCAQATAGGAMGPAESREIAPFPSLGAVVRKLLTYAPTSRNWRRQTMAISALNVQNINQAVTGLQQAITGLKAQTQAPAAQT